MVDFCEAPPGKGSKAYGSNTRGGGDEQALGATGRTSSYCQCMY